MKLKEFLEQHVEGYLFGDMESMKSFSLPPGKEHGALGYPLVMSALSGIELLGALTSARTFDRKSGRVYFDEFWQKYLYPAEPRRSAGDPLYKLARHGLAHAFFPKGPIVVTKNPSGPHLVMKNGRLYIDACVLSKDLRTAYEQGVKPSASMETRLQEMLKEYNDQAKPLLSLLQQLPAAPPGSLSTGSTAESNPPGGTTINIISSKPPQ